MILLQQQTGSRNHRQAEVQRPADLQVLLYHIIPGQLRSSDVTSSIIRGPVLPEVRIWV
jgi:uncharacterized surface protein with fasciclin (FAS1) repeats